MNCERHFRAIGWRLYQTYVLDAQGVLHDEAWGQHLEAEACFAQDLWLCQELGDAQREAFALAGQGRNALYQGDLECARAAFDQALSVSREVRSPATVILALRGQGLLAHYQGDEQQARACAQEALQIAQTTGQRRAERCALRLLGHALLGLGDVTAALVAYQQTLAIDQALGYRHLAVETTADLARAALAQGNIAQASACVADILADLDNGTLAGTEEPVRVYLTCFQVLRAAGEPRAVELGLVTPPPV